METLKKVIQSNYIESVKMVLSDTDPYHYHRPKNGSLESMEKESFEVVNQGMKDDLEGLSLPTEPVYSNDSTILSSNIAGSPHRIDDDYEESKSDRERQNYCLVTRYDGTEDRESIDTFGNSIEEEDDSLPSSINIEGLDVTPVGQLHSSMESTTLGRRDLRAEDEYHNILIKSKDSPTATRYSELDRIRGNMEALRRRLQNEVESHDHSEVPSESPEIKSSLNMFKNGEDTAPAPSDGPSRVVCEDGIFRRMESSAVTTNTTGNEDGKTHDKQPEVPLKSSQMASSLIIYENEEEAMPAAGVGSSHITCEDRISRGMESSTVMTNITGNEDGKTHDKTRKFSEMERELSQAQILRAMLLAEEASLSGVTEFKTRDKSIIEIDQVKVPAEAVESKIGAGKRFHHRMKLFVSKTIKRTQSSTRQVVTGVVGK